MPGQWERCGVEGVKNARGFHYKCNKKAGHKGEHADTKSTPAMYWKDNK